MGNVYYRFKDVSVEQFATLSDNFSTDLQTDYETRFSFRFLKNENVLVSRAEVNLLQGKELKMKAVFDCSFEIKGQSIEELTQEDRSIIFPKDVLVQLASLNYGTLRGIIIERMKGTAFSSVFLPPLFINGVIKEDFTVRAGENGNR